MSAAAATVVLLAGLEASYLWLVRASDRRPAFRTGASGRQRALFGLGVGTLLLALASPLHTLSAGYLLGAHALQHTLLLLVAAPLLLAGTPGWLVGRALQRPWTLPLARRLAHPLVAFALSSLVFAVGFLPSVHERLLASAPLELLYHAALLAAGLVVWLPVLSPLPERLPRLQPLAQIVYFFAHTIPPSLLGAALAYAAVPLYATYARAPRVITGFGALEDQHLAGLALWVGVLVYFFAASAVVFFAWAGREEAADRRAARTRYPVPSPVAGGDV